MDKFILTDFRCNTEVQGPPELMKVTLERPEINEIATEKEFTLTFTKEAFFYGEPMPAVYRPMLVELLHLIDREISRIDGDLDKPKVI